MKIKYAVILVVVLVWSVMIFCAGVVFREYRLLKSVYVTTKPFTLSGEGGSGILPIGTTLYSYGGPDEQPLFVAFIGTKELSSLRAQLSQHWREISPIVAFGE